MERIIKISRQKNGGEGDEGETLQIILHAIDDDLGRRVHLGGSMRIGRVVYLEPRTVTPPAQLGGLSKRLPDRHVLTMAPSDREVRTFFADCAGHWTAFRDQLELDEPQPERRQDLAFYTLLESTIMLWIRSPKWDLGKLTGELARWSSGGRFTVQELETN